MGADRWTQFALEAEQHVQTHLDRNDDFSIVSLRQGVFPLFIQRYGAPPMTSQNVDHQGRRNKWFHLRILKQLGTPDLPSLFSAWRHWTKFTQLDKQRAKTIQNIKKQKLDRLFALAARAEHRHDSYGLYKIIHETTTGRLKHRLQLGTPDGDLATPIEAQAQVRAYVQQAWHGTPRWPLPCNKPPGGPFTRQMLLDALSAIPIAKAVAPGFVPGPIWRELAPILVDPLMKQLQSWWSQSPPVIPPEWRHAWLSLIPKPNRAACAPQALRPLALQEPIGKCVIGILGSLARDLAFLPMRSAQDCIIRVTNHCRLARELVASQQPSVRRRAHQAIQHPVCGGLQLCADITRAFDAVSRPKLFEALARLGVSNDLLVLLQQWHMDCEYVLTGFVEPEGIPISRGVHQGCKVAPFLWCVLMTDYLR